jgi:hypothetical protein
MKQQNLYEANTLGVGLKVSNAIYVSCVCVCVCVCVENKI